jgi:hypothetical protein
MKNKLNSGISVTILIPFLSQCLASQNVKSSLKTILPFHYMDIKPGISPCGKNVDQALMEKISKIFVPKESNRNLEITTI